MLIPNPRHRRHFVFTGSTRIALLAEVVRDSDGGRAIRLISDTKAPVTDDYALPRLLSGLAGDIKGDLAISLPLHCFDIFSISLPVMPDEAIAKALPYHLAKALNRPLSDYLYDWQITQRHRDRLQVSCYLLPVRFYNHLATEFGRKHLAPVYLEPDIFSAYGYIDSNNRLMHQDASLCIIIWPDHLSLAVYDRKTMTLSRSVAAPQPQTEFKGKPKTFTVQEQPAGESSHVMEPELVVTLAGDHGESHPGLLDDESDSSILADFCLRPAENSAVCKLEPESTAAGQESPAASSDESWDSYLQQMLLEIMRTRDYHSSVLKGGPIKHVYVSGAGIFWDDLRTMIRSALGVDMQGVEQQLPSAIGPTFAALALGVASRW